VDVHSTDYGAGGYRILEAMRGATRYASAVHEAILDAAPKYGVGAILDFGAGDGVFVEKFDALGYAVDCVEPDASLARRLAPRANAVFSTISEVPAASYSFVYAVNVLEHIRDLDAVLKELFRALKPDGTLFVFVPAFEVLWTSLDDEVDHVRRFTRASLRTYLTRASFHCERSRYFDAAGFPAALAVRLLQAFGVFSYSGDAIGFYDSYVFPVSLVMDRVCSPLFGKNVIAIAKKTQKSRQG
jgi:SAM-dependent methyltransferase